jgi:type IV secretion system protein VirB10
MKDKFFKKQDDENDVENTEEEADVEAGGPAVDSAKRNKIAIIATSSIFITVVIYFIFFKNGAPEKTNLEEVIVKTSTVSPIAQSESGKSPFEIETPKKDENIEMLEKPETPEIPTLPELSSDATKDGLVSTDEIQKQLEQDELQKKIDEQKKQLEQLQQSSLGQQAQGVVPGQAATVQGQAAPTSENKITDPRYSPIIVISGGAGPPRSIGYDNNIINLQDNAIDKLEKSKVDVKTSYIDNRPNTISQGKLLTAVIETAINTEIPGLVRAIVSRDVYGEAGNEVLIPRGSRLFGSYSSEIARGQGRVQIGWTRLIRPDGVDLAISSVASDQFGRAGIQGQVNNKYGSTITNSLLTSLLTVGSVATAEKLLGGGKTTTTTTNPSLGSVTTTGQASNQAIYDVSRTIVDSMRKVITGNLDTSPVITVPQGTRITVIVNADMNIPSMKKRQKAIEN